MSCNPQGGAIFGVMATSSIRTKNYQLCLSPPCFSLSYLASCATRLIGAKLFRRVHWLCCTLLHKHIMPRTVLFFKPLPQFHWLVGLYPFNLFSGFFLKLERIFGFF